MEFLDIEKLQIGVSIFVTAFITGIMMTLFLFILNKAMGLKIIDKNHYFKLHQKITLSYGLAVILRAGFLVTVLLYFLSSILVERFHKENLKIEK